jgi:hypothetical protein
MMAKHKHKNKNNNLIAVAAALALFVAIAMYGGPISELITGRGTSAPGSFNVTVSILSECTITDAHEALTIQAGQVGSSGTFTITNDGNADMDINVSVTGATEAAAILGAGSTAWINVTTVGTGASGAAGTLLKAGRLVITNLNGGAVSTLYYSAQIGSQVAIGARATIPTLIGCEF